MSLRQTIGSTTWVFDDLKDLMAKATPPRSGDVLAGVAAGSAEQAVAARMLLADQPLSRFLAEPLVPYETDEVTRLICDGHDDAAFAPIASLTVGEFREFLLGESATSAVLAALAPGVTPEMAAAVSKLMRNQDLILAASRCRVTTAFRDTIGLPGTMSARLQPEPPERRPGRHHRVDPGRPLPGQWRCGDRDQSRDRQPGCDRGAGASAGCADRPL